VCADCWGSKGGPQFWIRKADQGWPLELSPFVLGTIVAGLPILALVLLWLLD
jgi:hypothetical protein